VGRQNEELASFSDLTFIRFVIVVTKMYKAVGMDHEAVFLYANQGKEPAHFNPDP